MVICVKEILFDMDNRQTGPKEHELDFTDYFVTVVYRVWSFNCVLISGHEGSLWCCNHVIENVLLIKSKYVLIFG
jgi:hypothetical protein